jgi:hypothetical protein
MLVVLVVVAAILGVVGCGGSESASHETQTGTSWGLVESLLAEKTGWNAQAAKEARRLAEEEGVTAAEGERCYLGAQLPGEWPRGCAVFAKVERTSGSENRGRRILAEGSADERSREQTSRNDETTQHAGVEAESSNPHGSWGGIQYAVEQQGWSSREAADFVLQMAEEGLNPRRAQGTAAAAFVLEEHGYSHHEAVQGARETEVALEGR